MTQLRALLAKLGLELAEDKTRLVCVNEDGEGFDFLGYHHRMVISFSRPGFRFMAAGRRRARRARQGRGSVSSPTGGCCWCRSRTSWPTSTDF